MPHYICVGLIRLSRLPAACVNFLYVLETLEGKLCLREAFDGLDSTNTSVHLFAKNSLESRGLVWLLTSALFNRLARLCFVKSLLNLVRVPLQHQRNCDRSSQ